jgi:hypothetical protein
LSIFLASTNENLNKTMSGSWFVSICRVGNSLEFVINSPWSFHTFKNLIVSKI